MQARTPTSPADDPIIHLTVNLPVDPDAAFALFADPARLSSWLVPRATVEPRPGGRYELFWAPDDPDNDSTIGCRISAFDRPRLLAFSWRSPRQFKAFANAADPLTHVVVTFGPVDSGTRVHLVHTGWRSSAPWRRAREWQERAWRAAFDSPAGTARAVDGADR